jgi:hypothetical protein
MCRRYYRQGDKQKIAEAFHVEEVDEFPLPPWDHNRSFCSILGKSYETEPCMRASPDQSVPTCDGDSNRNQPETNRPLNGGLLQAVVAACLAAVMIGSITGAGYQSNGSGAGRAKHRGPRSVVHEVGLSWNAPASSPDPVAGYNIYRSSDSATFVLLNTSPVTALSYIDNTVGSGASYTYEVKSVDSSGVESIPSDQVTATVP